MGKEVTFTPESDGSELKRFVRILTSAPVTAATTLALLIERSFDCVPVGIPQGSLRRSAFSFPQILAKQWKRAPRFFRSSPGRRAHSPFSFSSSRGKDLYSVRERDALQTRV